MKKTFLIMAVSTTIASFGQNQNPIKYPTTNKGETVDVYFDTKLADPYRWLEDDKSAETGAWVKAQNKVTYDYLAQIPFRDVLKARMEKLWNYEKIGAPFKEGNYTYYYKNNGLQNQSVLYRKDVKGTETVFLDPNTFSKDGTTSLGGLDFSKDGSKVAYAISEGGSDWRKVIIMDAITQKIIEDTLVDVKFSGVSWRGNEGFYYSSYDKPKGSELSAKTDQHKLYYHTLGTPQKQDKIIFGADQKRRYVGGHVTEDNHYLVITASTSTYGNELYIKDLTKSNSPIVTIVDNFKSDSNIIDNEGGKLFIETDLNAPNKRIVTVDVNNPKPENWKDFIPETENVLSPSTGGGYFFANYMKDAVSVVKQYDYSGKLVREIQLPGVGTAGGFSGKKKEKILYYSFTNYITPGSIYSFEPKSGTSAVYEKPKVDFNSEEYESKQVFYTSKDGTKIPMIITHKKGLKLDGTNPTMLYGYGGFNVSLTPSFSIANAVWMENGGIFAVPNLRGGGEYGKKWHDAGTKMQKQNVFDDFIAAAEYLIAQKYTSSEFLAIRGGSNGGLLVGATMNQRPELMKVALPAVGVMDMLRYHTFTSGAGWAYDYGTAQDSKEMFDYIKGYSPVHNIKKGIQYPATMITTGDHDDRVVPAHSFKFAAELQEKQTGINPTLIRIDINAGHGAGKSVAATIQENVDIQAFTLYNMGVNVLQKLNN
ncbi:prolyl oligopeptidase family serine peptidase [Flavobacterium gawalongense]|uniref:prolyl oligopeptidase n=1 Tax=Flavobacterium gawalongense TaxID=2594432 RepID=A0A553BLW4_9FLAO|nr:prolyl oligopeptidase family serine peptidase [Flavobacterium gawalongense]TRX01257.1 S9 family peptidase [Flavobacterium gawalongense]TRX01407.1 S9 family peptidase [Flavobacterium gawalongense]TRX06052.1 S9 family peptidase [Flavobacterium gawalongense]TRX09246.1 S9 family peptidase [Flavobacterium gawalongense]TRX21859.1 S9 family peptidase [Flavobacterium gawalongense]